jgi:hypothetical protein
MGAYVLYTGRGRLWAARGVQGSTKKFKVSQLGIQKKPHVTFPLRRTRRHGSPPPVAQLQLHATYHMPHMGFGGSSCAASGYGLTNSQQFEFKFKKPSAIASQALSKRRPARVKLLVVGCCCCCCCWVLRVLCIIAFEFRAEGPVVLFVRIQCTYPLTCTPDIPEGIGLRWPWIRAFACEVVTNCFHIRRHTPGLTRPRGSHPLNRAPKKTHMPPPPPPCARAPCTCTAHRATGAPSPPPAASRQWRSSSSMPHATCHIWDLGVVAV